MEYGLYLVLICLRPWHIVSEDASSIKASSAAICFSISLQFLHYHQIAIIAFYVFNSSMYALFKDAPLAKVLLTLPPAFPADCPH